MSHNVPVSNSRRNFSREVAVAYGQLVVTDDDASGKNFTGRPENTDIPDATARGNDYAGSGDVHRPVAPFPQELLHLEPLQELALGGGCGHLRSTRT
jgi:hypothetical protein